MKTLKKAMSLILALGMTMALFAVSASAATGDTLETILANYTVDTPTYTQIFDNEASVAAFGTMATGTASFDSTNKRLVLTKSTNSSTGDQFSSVTNLLRDCTSSIESKKFYLEYSLEGSASLGDVYVNIGTSATSIQTGVYFHFGTGLMDVKDGSSGTLKNLSGLNTTGKNTIKQLYDFENHKYYMWVNDTLVLGDTQSRSIAQTNRTNLYNMYIKLYNGTAGESLYVDDVKIVPLVEKPVVESPYMPSANSTVAYSESFAQVDGKTDVTDAVYSYNGVNALPSATGNAASNCDDLSITSDGELQISGNKLNRPHCWYFGSDATSAMANISGDLLISMDIRATEAGAITINLGTGTNANAVLTTSWSKSGITFMGGEESKKLTFLLDKESSTYSIWIDETLVVERAVGTNVDVNSYSSVNAINIRPNATNVDQTVYIDNLKVTGVADDTFYKIDKVMRSVGSVEDIATMGGDSNIVNIDTSSLPQTGATITVEDNKGYYNGTDLIFPIKADTTDITVTVSYGDKSESKTFEDVTIPSAYSFGEINWGTDAPQAGSVYDSAVVAATVRNQASDNTANLLIFAALYDAEGSELIKVQSQADTLYEGDTLASGFSISLDLTTIDEIPENAIVKVFIFNQNTLEPLVTEVYSKTF